MERSITATGDFTVTLPGGLVTVQDAARRVADPADPQDYILVLRVDAGPAGPGFVTGTPDRPSDRTLGARGNCVTEFNEPIEITFANPAAVPAIPAWSQIGTNAAPSWNNMGRLEGSTLPAARPDGFHGDTAACNVLTHHLTFFGLKVDDGLPRAPRHIAGVVAADGLTLRWIPGTDASGQLGNMLLYVNGERYRTFGPRQYETKIGAFTPGDSRIFTLVQLDAAGNPARTRGAPCRPAGRRQEPRPGGAALAAARLRPRHRARAAGRDGRARHGCRPDRTPQAALSTKIDFVVSREFTAPQTQLVFSVAGSKRSTLKEADDDRRPGQGLPARHSDRDAVDRRGRSGSTPGRSDTSRPAPTS